ncbi:MAG: TonB-dependent receptor [Chitinophagaceae bacterium]
MCKRRLTVILLFILSTLLTKAQVADTSLLKELDNVVITATRNEGKLGNIAIPTQLITTQMIKATGSLRLQDILQEQTGLTIVNSPLGISLAGFPNIFGAGIQMQGLDPAYTLILMDGEPLVGRNAGILKLGRVAVGNIKQIEIVKGPSSSLYGADAMAGVINIITEKPVKENAAVQLQYASNNTLSLAMNYSNRINKTGIQLFANRYSTSGYDLDKIMYGKTVDPFTDNSYALKITQYISSSAQFIVSARYFGERQTNNYLVTDQGVQQIINGTTREKDWGLNLQFIQQLKKSFKFTSRLYFNQYTNNSDEHLQKNNAPFDALRFLQQVIKPEIQIEKTGNNSKFISGIGFMAEAIDASRYDRKHNFRTLYVFSQEEWTIAKGYNLIAGARVDKRNDFDWRVSPKLALSGKISDKFFLSASVGLGYRTPDARQSYALFTNSSVGYSLLGAEVLKTALDKLKQEGQIEPSVNTSLYENNAALKAETSVGMNLGLRFTPHPNLLVNANIFRNDMKNLIDRYTLPFNKNNGQSIYSYHNVNRVYTQGFSADATWNLNKHFIVSGGYQFLIAKDKDVINGIKQNRYYKRDPVTFKTDTVRLKDYGGLLYRSRNSANIKVMYKHAATGLSGWFRVNYTGRFGYIEKNGSGILDDKNEYESGFLLCNLTLSKHFTKNLDLQTGIDNLFNYKQPFLMPNLAGRIFFVNLNMNFDKILNVKQRKA